MQKKRVGFFRKKILIISSSLVMLCIVYTLNIYSFLVIDKPVNGQVMVIEGWIPSLLLEQAAGVFKQGSYEIVVAVGGPSKGEISESVEETYAYRCKKELTGFGIPAEKIEMVPVLRLKKNRTFTIAKAFNVWLKEFMPSVEKVDIFTASVHGRKSRMLYRRVLGESIQVGVISGRSEVLRSRFWLTSKRMIYLVLRNTVGYFNALLFTF